MNISFDFLISLDNLRRLKVRMRSCVHKQTAERNGRFKTKSANPENCSGKLSSGLFFFTNSFFVSLVFISSSLMGNSFCCLFVLWFQTNTCGWSSCINNLWLYLKSFPIWFLTYEMTFLFEAKFSSDRVVELSSVVISLQQKTWQSQKLWLKASWFMHKLYEASSSLELFETSQLTSFETC